MIEKAQRKLREARFFYNLLNNARRDLPEMTPRLSTDDPEAFRFYFSAFIQSLVGGLGRFSLCQGRTCVQLIILKTTKAKKRSPHSVRVTLSSWRRQLLISSVKID